MAEKVIIDKSILTDIGNAIREKEESSDLIPSTEMATRIRDFQGGAKIVSGGVEKILKGEYNGDSVSITKPENVNISALIDEQKLPLAVNVDIPTYDGEQEGGEPFVNPLQKLIDKTQQVRYLFFQYPDSDLQDVVDSIELTNVKDCQGICYGVKNVESITLNLPNTTDLTDAFCKGNFKKIVVNTTSALTKVSSIIQSCMYLEDFTLTDMKGVSNYQSAINFMFPNGKLVNFKVNNIKVNMTFYSDVLSVESLIYTIQQLIDVGSTRNLTIGSKNLAKIENVYVRLTGKAEEDEANPKLPCEVCESTDEDAMTIIAYANSKNWTIA